MSVLDNKDKRQFHRSIDSLNKILRDLKEHYPDAHYSFDGYEFKLLTSPDRPGDKKQRNIAVRSFLDGDEKACYE